MRRPFVAALMAALPSLALAATEPEPVPGMPQLAFGHAQQGPLLIAQVVWMLIIFGVLYVVLRNVALPRVAEVLDERRRRIETDLEAAREAKDRADEAIAEQRAATLRARAEAQSAIAAAVHEATAEAGKRAEELNARLSAQVAAAERRIAEARNAAMAALKPAAIDTAVAMVAKLVGSADQQRVTQAVERELAGGRA